MRFQHIKALQAGVRTAKVKRLRRVLRRARLRISELIEESEWQWRQVRMTSSLTGVKHHVLCPSGEGWAWRWFESFCPCCKRPIDVTMLRCANKVREAEEREEDSDDVGPETASTEMAKEKLAALSISSEIAGVAESPAGCERCAMAVVMWGTSPGFALGALVLGAQLRELGTAADLLLLHTDEVPQNHLELLSSCWRLRQVEYIDGASGLFYSKGHRFDGVFTKINVWAATEYSKVLLLDIDIIPLHSLDPLFDLHAPAAFHRGRDDFSHGAPVDGRLFFIGEEDKEWAWCQGGGINAGVILLEPRIEIFQRMLHEVTCEVHPERVPGAGPEQDYFSRFFASTPWHHISVSYNPKRIFICCCLRV